MLEFIQRRGSENYSYDFNTGIEILLKDKRICLFVWGDLQEYDVAI